MKIIKENNISRVIIVSFAIILSALMVLTIYYSTATQYSEFEKELNNLRSERINNQKIFLKMEVDSVIDFINFVESSTVIDDGKKLDMIKKYINNIRFGENRHNYVFVYKITNFKGGDRFAKMYINPNRKDLVGKYISTNYKDADGKKFREEFLRGIVKSGESFVMYRYKKPGSNKKSLKLSYFRLYKKHNWVVAAGIYLDDIEKAIDAKRAVLLKHVKNEIITTIVIYILFFIVAFLFAVIIGRRIDKFFKSYKDQVMQKTIELEKLNRTLEERVEKEVKKNREKDQFLIQKSKFIALGEMISNIAHQWRQPLNELSAIMLNIKMRYRKGLMDSKYMDKKGEDIDRLLEFMSQTIDDFRNFFLPDKKKRVFLLKSACEKVLMIMGSSLKDKNIKITMDIDEGIKIYGYKSEFEQVVLNILSNAKYALTNNGVNNPEIIITAKDEENKVVLHILDNAGGVKVEPVEKIFEPYFTTKDTSSGTGLGLYMSRLIIERNMGGILKVKNREKGADFIVEIKKGD